MFQMLKYINLLIIKMGMKLIDILSIISTLQEKNLKELTMI